MTTLCDDSQQHSISDSLAKVSRAISRCLFFWLFYYQYWITRGMQSSSHAPMLMLVCSRHAPMLMFVCSSSHLNITIPYLGRSYISSSRTLSLNYCIHPFVIPSYISCKNIVSRFTHSLYWPIYIKVTHLADISDQHRNYTYCGYQWFIVSYSIEFNKYTLHALL